MITIHLVIVEIFNLVIILIVDYNFIQVVLILLLQE